MLNYVKPERIQLKNHPYFNEAWVQQRIAEDPSLLGLGRLILRDKERSQPNAGRLDLLLEDPDSEHWYEVEVQLGKTDESHIIRTIEYWDIERKRYPQYDHTAVIVAEEITGRFLNVISLFNGVIPLTAIQMQALVIGSQVSLVFTTVLQEMQLGQEDEESDALELVNRDYWEERSSKATIHLADRLLAMIKTLDESYSLRYTKSHVGLSRHGQANNFVVMQPKKNWLRTNIRLDKSDVWDTQLEDSALDFIGYSKSGRYRLRLTEGALNQEGTLLEKMLKASYEQFGK